SLNQNLAGSSFSTVFATSTLTNAPSALTIPQVQVTSLTVVLSTPSADQNPVITPFAIFNVTENKWLQSPSNGASVLGSNPAWNTYSHWGGPGGVSNTGLLPNTSYTYRVTARNNSDQATQVFSADFTSATLA